MVEVVESPGGAGAGLARMPGVHGVEQSRNQTPSCLLKNWKAEKHKSRLEPRTGR